MVGGDLQATGGNRRMSPAGAGAIRGWKAGGCGRLGRWLATGENRRMWPADIGADDGWRAGRCGRPLPPIPLFGPCLAIDGWVTPPSLLVFEQSNTVPRVRGGFGCYTPFEGRATGIRQQFLWVTTDRGPRVRQQQAQVHIRVQLNTRICSAWASNCANTLTLGD